MRVIAYKYEADIHCIDCAQIRFGHFALKGHDVITEAGVFTSYKEGVPTELDEWCIPLDAKDREGNPVHPVFSTDEVDLSVCGTCLREI